MKMRFIFFNMSIPYCYQGEGRGVILPLLLSLHRPLEGPADRIRSLERDNATSGMQLQEQAGTAPAAAAAGGRGSSSGQAAQKGSSSVPKPLAGSKYFSAPQEH